MSKEDELMSMVEKIICDVTSSLINVITVDVFRIEKDYVSAPRD